MDCPNSQPDQSQMQMEQLELEARMADIDKKLLVLSGKGGVGKSTVATNLAFSLAEAGKKVGLLDADLHGPSIPGMLGLKGQRMGSDEQGKIHPIEMTENLKVVSIAMMLEDHNAAVIWRGPMKYTVIRQLLKDVEWGKLDYLVVDLPPGTGDESLSVAQLVGGNASAVIVTTPQEVAIADVRRCVSFCNTLELNIAGIIENMSGLICPHCKERIELFKTGGGEKLAQEMNVPFLGQIPIEPQIVHAGDSGLPFIQQFRQTEASEAFAAAVSKI